MASELKFRSWEELFDFLLKIPVDVRLRYLSLLLKKKLNKGIHDKLEEMQTKAQQELDAMKLWKRSPAMQGSGAKVVEERRETVKKTALENAVAGSDLGIKKTSGGIVEYTRAEINPAAPKTMYGAKGFEESKEGVSYTQKQKTPEYMVKSETEYTARVSSGGMGSFKTSEEILKESEKYKLKYKSK